MHRTGPEKVGPEKLTAAKSEDAAHDVEIGSRQGYEHGLDRSA